MSGEWLTATGASQALGISERTVRRRANKGLIESKLEKGRRLFLVDIDRTVTGAATDTSALVEQLRSEVEHLKQELDRRNEQIDQQNMIVMQLTRQLEQSQRLLEYHRDPWYKRWFRKRQKAQDGNRDI